MVDYHRGVIGDRKNDLWHWHPDCRSYPHGAFAIRRDQPPQSELCSRCASLSGH